MPWLKTNHMKMGKGPWRHRSNICGVHPTAQILYCHKHRWWQIEWCTKCYDECPKCQYKKTYSERPKPLVPPKRQFAMNRTRAARVQPTEETSDE